MIKDQFFEEQTEASLIKTRIVSKYFDYWRRVMRTRVNRPNDRLAFYDLFSGPGCYEDGNPSTPLLVLKQAIDDPILRESLVTLFNDSNPAYASRLAENIRALPGLGQLRYYPEVTNREVDSEFAAEFTRRKLAPSLSFIDPWGYKGITLELISSMLKDWGCDLILFFQLPANQCRDW